jgi:hypothetical protein
MTCTCVCVCVCARARAPPSLLLCAVCPGAPPASLLGGIGTWPAECTNNVSPGGICSATCNNGTYYGGATIECTSNGWDSATFSGRCSASPGMPMGPLPCAMYCRSKTRCSLEMKHQWSRGFPGTFLWPPCAVFLSCQQQQHCFAPPLLCSALII